LATLGRSTATISSRLWRQYSRDSRVRVHTNRAVEPQMTRLA
jgi:hypothetical protein